MDAPQTKRCADGRKIACLLHLADGAVGFLLMLGVVIVVGSGRPLPFLGHSLEPLLQLLANDRSMLLLLGVLLAKPVGILISEASKLLISWYEPPLIRFWLNFPKKMPDLSSGGNLVSYAELKRFFNISEHQEAKSGDLCKTARHFEAYLIAFFGERVASPRISVLMSLARNLAVLTFFSFMSYLHVAFWNDEVSFSLPASCLLVLIALSFSLLYAFMASFCCLKSLSAVHSLCAVHGISNEHCLSPQDLIDKLHAACFGCWQEQCGADALLGATTPDESERMAAI